MKRRNFLKSLAGLAAGAMLHVLPAPKMGKVDIVEKANETVKWVTNPEYVNAPYEVAFIHIDTNSGKGKVSVCTNPNQFNQSNFPVRYDRNGNVIPPRMKVMVNEDSLDLSKATEYKTNLRSTIKELDDMVADLDYTKWLTKS